MVYWVLIRHAPIIAPVTGFCGVTDKDADIRKVPCIASQLRDSFVMSSPLRRCQQTAQALGLPVQMVSPKIQEQNFGAWEAQPYPSKQHDFWRDPAFYRPPGGESFADVCLRIASCLETYQRERIVCVTHAGVIRAALAHALQLSPSHALSFEINILSVTIIRKVEEAWSITCTNCPLDFLSYFVK